MARPSRLTVSKKDIFSLFDGSPKKVYSQSELAGILSQNRTFWRLAERTSANEFISFLAQQGRLQIHTFLATAYARKLIRYSWGDASKYELALSIQARGYLSHATAIALHGLTDLIPEGLYLNVEQSPKPIAHGALTQRGIDQAFSRKQRQSNLVYETDGWATTIISGKNTNRLAVESVDGPSSERLQVTDLERTLIDIVVRPAYSGGIFQVFRAYQSAKSRFSTNRLIATLKKLDYVYPYHQAIGFLMERAGYDQKRYEMLRKLGVKYNFYLVHGMHKPLFSEKWKLFYPDGLDL